MSEDFKVDIVNPDRSFFSNDKVKEIVVPAVEGDMGILKDHIPIISFLKPGIIFLSTNEGLQKFYVEDGIIEFRDNTLSILTSTIMDLKNIDKSFIDNNIKDAEKQLENSDLNDQARFLMSQKINVLRTIN
tara:strand:- start:4054 stop:4446 length:393 start_codon:yes stop_codon:yes gene_type:complete